MNVSLYYDLFFAVFLILFFFIFYKKGFVGSFINVFGLVIAFLGGNYVSNSASKTIYDRLLKDRLTEYVTKNIQKIQSGISDTFSNGLIGKLFSNFIKEQSLDSDASELADRFPNQLLGGALGLVIGLVILFILCSLMSLILDIWSTSWFNKDVIEGSFLFSKLFELNPFYT